MVEVESASRWFAAIDEALGKNGTPLPGSPMALEWRPATPEERQQGKRGGKKPVPLKRSWSLEDAGTFTIEMRRGKGRNPAKGYFVLDTSGIGDPETARNVANNVIRRVVRYGSPPMLWANAPEAPAKKTPAQLMDAIAKTVDKDGRKGRGKTRMLNAIYADGDLVNAVLGVKLGEKTSYGGWSSWFGTSTDPEVVRFIWSQRVPRLSKAVERGTKARSEHRKKLEATRASRQSAADAKLTAMLEKYEKAIGPVPKLPPRITPEQEADMPAPQVSVNDVDQKTAAAAFRGTSFREERRGQQYRRDYAAMWNEMADRVADKANTIGQREAAIEVLERFRTKYRNAFKAFLSSHGNVTSWMITGRSGRNARREQKKSDSADRRRNEWTGLVEDAAKYAERAINKEAKRESGGDAAIQLRKFKALVAAKRAGKGVGNEITLKARQLDDILRRLRAEQAEGEVTITAPDGTEVTVEVADERIRLSFPKDAVAFRQQVKSAGFRWSPRNKAWQRKMTGNAEYAAARVLFGDASAPTMRKFSRMLRGDKA